MAQSVIWKSRTRGDQVVSEMNTVYIKNCINKVEAELNESAVADRAAKETILAALKTEFATRDPA